MGKLFQWLPLFLKIKLTGIPNPHGIMLSEYIGAHAQFGLQKKICVVRGLPNYSYFQYGAFKVQSNLFSIKP